jgi:Neuraminidase (sialidase)
MVRSRDDGKTWSAPETINNTPLDDRDAGILVTNRGTIIVSWFTSLAFDDSNYAKHYPPDTVKSWKRHAEKLGPEIRKHWLGSWVRRSTDGGRTWGEPIRVLGTAPHGPIQLRDGRLLYTGRVHWDAEPAISVEESRDDGQTWRRIGTVPLPSDIDIRDCHEPHPVEAADGTLIVMIREQKKIIMLQSESADGGKTWSTAHSTGIWGLPPHLLRLKDNRIVAVYGHRRKPFSERACISTDNGKTWNGENPIELAPALDGDLGYPASVELDDGSILTVYYQKEKTGEKTCLMGTRWKAPAP